MQFAVANKAELGVDVINLSLGHPIYESATLTRSSRRFSRRSRPASSSSFRPATPAWTRRPVCRATAASYRRAMRRSHHDGIGEHTGHHDARGRRRQQLQLARAPRLTQVVKPDLVAPGYRLVEPSSRESTLFKNNPRLLRQELAHHPQRNEHGVRPWRVAWSRSCWSEHEGAFALQPTLTPNAVKAILEFTALL